MTNEDINPVKAEWRGRGGYAGENQTFTDPLRAIPRVIVFWQWPRATKTKAMRLDFHQGCRIDLEAQKGFES